MSQRYVHFKGGKYLRLFDCLAVARSPNLVDRYDRRADDVLFTAKHADDKREVTVFVDSKGGGVFVFDASTSIPYEVVVYVSCTYGDVWVRRKEEFEGLKDGKPRFEPVDAFPVAP